MRRFWTVYEFELKSYMKNKSFVITTIVLAVLLFGAMFLPRVFDMSDMLGIEKSHVAAIGDYYNDWDMLKTVGLPACAGQAPSSIHKICKFEACHCNKGCVADLLEYIMSGDADRDIAEGKI